MPAMAVCALAWLVICIVGVDVPVMTAVPVTAVMLVVPAQL